MDIIETKEVPKNSLANVQFRELVGNAQATLKTAIIEGKAQDALPDCTLTHHFTPKDEKYGCHAYAREMFIPKGTLIIGKIHRHQHLNFITKGEVIVATEFGNKELKAPCTFVSEVGLKRAVYAVEDTLWTTVHLTEHGSEELLDQVEEEVIAPTYSDIGLIASVDEYLKLENKGDFL
jgi:quercetin dioxygenase-like cupin family protein